jgi:hypothetical protein
MASGQVGEDARHLGGRFHVALAVARSERASRGRERDVVADAGEDVEQLALRGAE